MITAHGGAGQRDGKLAQILRSKSADDEIVGREIGFNLEAIVP